MVRIFIKYSLTENVSGKSVKISVKIISQPVYMWFCNGINEKF